MSPFACTSLSLLLLPLVAALPTPQGTTNITHTLTTHMPVPTNVTHSANYTLTTHLPIPTNLTYPYNLNLTTHLPLPTTLTTTTHLNFTTHARHPTLPRRSLHTTHPLNFTTPHPSFPTDATPTASSSKLAATGIQLSDEELAAQGEPTWSLGLYKRSLPTTLTTPHTNFTTHAPYPTLPGRSLHTTKSHTAHWNEDPLSLAPYKRSLPTTLSTNNHTAPFPLPNNHTAPLPTLPPFPLITPRAPLPTAPPHPAITPRAPLPAFLISVTALPCCDAAPTTTLAATRHKVRDCVSCSTKVEEHGGFYNTMEGLLGNFESAVLEFLPTLTTSQKRDVSELQGGEGVASGVFGEDGLDRLFPSGTAGSTAQSSEDDPVSVLPLSADDLTAMDLGPPFIPSPPPSAPSPEAADHRLTRREELTDEYSPLNALYPGHDPLNPLRKAKPHDAAVRAAVHARYMRLYGELWLKKLVDELAEAQKNVDQQVSVGRAAVREKEYLGGKRKAVETQVKRMKGEAEEAERLSVVADVKAVGGSAGMDVGFLGG